ncbi:MAG: Ig-like domain-containing domain [Planctomycetota bacterium]|jgi:hypothetical protein
MQLRLPTASALTLLLALFGACSSSSGRGSKDTSAACDPSAQTKFCLLSCSLGCTRNGCSVTDIAQNQPIVLDFSQDVDPTSVNAATISLKTASGQTPTGRFEVLDKRVVFVPDIKFIAGVTRFGFTAGETYFLTLPASSGSDTLRSASGVPLAATLTCSLAVTQGIVDLNAKPPAAKLLSPKATSNVAPDTVIVLEFDEFIDVAPFRGSTTETSPTTYVIRKTREKPSQAGVRECDPNFKPITLEGLPKAEIDPVRGVTTVTLKPSVPLPSQICVEVGVTSRVKDLAGKSAEPAKFIFTTEIVAPGVGEIKETFANDGQLDKAVSSGIWGNGTGLPPKVGGTGVHGSFQPSSGTAYFDNVTKKTSFIWSTDKQVIPKQLTQSGQEETITDGVFHFTDFLLPAGVHVVFEGSNPAVINVRGKCQIDGTLDLGVAFRDVNRNILLVLLTPDTMGGKPGGGNPFGYDAESAAGQAATKGGPGGGRGGKGGDPCLNNGPASQYNGADGDDVQLKSGHSYAAQAQGTGGPGAPLYPQKGRLISTSGDDYDVLTTYAAYTGAGGGGGGFHNQGTESQVFQVPPIGGTATRQPNDGIRMGPKIQGGKAFDPTLATPSGTALDHYLIGGPGGGGGCSHPLLTSGTSTRWLGGAAGCGGGGAIAFRVGQDVSMALSGIISARGGSGFTYGTDTAELFNLPCAGGGGAGGTIMMQVFGNVSLAGKLDTSGGIGGGIDNTKTQVASVFGVRAKAGNGSPGYVRLETPGGAKAIELGSTIPAAGAKHVGTLTDVDIKSSSQSRFYSTRLTFPPTFLRYELEVVLNGTTRKLYSDDADVGKPTINGQPNPIYDQDYAGRATSTEPVWFRLQGATVSTVTNLPDLQTLGPWREFVKGNIASINIDLANGFRFLLTFDQSITQQIEVRRMSVFFAD